MKIIYRNKEGLELTLGQQPPFLISSKKGFGGVENNITTVEQYGFSGKYEVYQHLAERELEVNGEILATSPEEIQDYRIYISSILNPELAGTLIFQNFNRSFEIDVLITKQSFDIATENLTQKFSVEFVALDSFWSDVTLPERTIPLSSSNRKLKFPLQITSDFEFGSLSSASIVKITNTGDIPTGVTFNIRTSAQVVNPKILNVVTQEFFGFSGKYDSNVSFMIETRKGLKEVTKNVHGVQSNAISERMANSSFIQLEKGDNFFILQADKGAENLSGNLTFTPLILGV